MAGWPFDKLALNPKCLALSGAMVTAYWYLPCRYDQNAYRSAAFIATASYVGLAWYDYYYDCSVKMKPGLIAPFTKFMKPPIKRGVYGGSDMAKFSKF